MEQKCKDCIHYNLHQNGECVPHTRCEFKRAKWINNDKIGNESKK